ncbi:glycosyltransferase family 2 protein [Halomonas sp. HK25]|uniref:glycosyltransferase family 2 protein n=1 Tax=Halomonas sp. HK25 TaxID=3394321 RepID=UPI0039FC5A98
MAGLDEMEQWSPGIAPVAVVMISLNEAHNMEDVLENLRGWAQEVFLVDSYSADDTVDIALSYGVHTVQRKFCGFGDQWNFAISELPITAPWTMKLDPDERLTDELKDNIIKKISNFDSIGVSFERRLWFMGSPLPIKQEIVRVWRTGLCRFTDVAVNEHPLVDGLVSRIYGYLEHLDSPNLQHWLEKQNRYSTAEAVGRFNNAPYAVKPRLLGSPLARRMWFKKHFFLIPFRYFLVYVINLARVKPWQSGYAGFAWARQRVWVRRVIEDKYKEMLFTGRAVPLPEPDVGIPDSRVKQYTL